MPVYGPILGDTGTWQPSDHGVIAWSYDPALASSSTVINNTGTVQTVRLKLDNAASITNIYVWVANIGVTLTANQCIAGIYQAGSLIGSTADQSVAWVSTGMKTMALTGGPFAVTAGDLIVAFYSNGTTAPGFARVTTSSAALVNFNIVAASSRFGTADTGRTTTLPGTLGTIAAGITSWWVAVS